MTRRILILSALLFSMPAFAEQTAQGASEDAVAAPTARARMEWERRPRAQIYASQAAASIEKFPELLAPAGGGLRDVKSACPRFERMNETEKKDFWKNFAMTVALMESSLKPPLRFQGSDGRTYAGLYGFLISKDQRLIDKSKYPECVFANVVKASDAVRGHDCFFKHVTGKLKDPSCLFCDTGAVETMALKNSGANRRIRQALSQYGPCRSD